MVLGVTNANNVKIYTVSGGLGSRSVPDWLARKKKLKGRKKKDEGNPPYLLFNERIDAYSRNDGQSKRTRLALN